MNDWHPPVMAVLWRNLINLTGLTGSFVILQISMLWAALLLLGSYIIISKRSVLWSFSFLAIGLLPYILNISGVVWKDVLMAYSLLLSFNAILFLNNKSIKKNRLARYALIILSICLMVFAVQLRYNAIMAVLPILYYLIKSISHKRYLLYITPVIFIAVTFMYGYAIGKVYNVEKVHPEVYIMMDDIYHVYPEAFDGNSEFSQQMDGAKEKCKIQSPQLGIFFLCISPEGQKLSMQNSDLVSDAWVSTIKNKPIDYASYRINVFFGLMLPGSERSYYVWQDGIHPNDIGLHNNKNSAHNFAEKYVKFFAQDFGFLFRPYFWIIMAMLLILLNKIIIKINNEIDDLRIPIYILCSSAILYILTYVVLGVGTDYRYIYWSALSTSVALVLTFIRNTKKRS